MARKALSLALGGLALLVPSAQAQDSVNGTATVVDGADTTTYQITGATQVGNAATGTILREFVGPGGNATAFANVTCVAVEGQHAVLIGEIDPALSVNVGYEAQLIQIFDGTPDLQPDGVASGTDPKVGGVTTFTECGAFLPPFPFPTVPVTLGDFVLVDAPAPPPPPPPDCDDDDDNDHQDDDDDECEDEDDY